MKEVNVIRFDAGRQMLELSIDGIPAFVIEPRQWFLEHGCVYLSSPSNVGATWEDRVSVKIDDTIYRGMTDSPLVMRKVKQYFPTD